MASIRILEPIRVGFGNISAGEISDKEIITASKQIKHCLANVSPMAPSCCMDGRYSEGTLDDITEIAEARPSVAGGADITAYAAAEMTGIWFAKDNNQTVKERLTSIDTTLREQGIIPGAHSDECAVKDNFKDKKTGLFKIGCGPSDHFTDILDRHYDSFDIIDRYTAMLLGSKFDQNYMKLIPNDKLQDAVKKWNSIDPLHIITEASSGNSVEILRGDHSEVVIIFNFIKDTTLDRYRFLSKSNVKAFVIDMWYIDKIAFAMAATRPKSIEMFSQLKHAMVAFQIATYLTLCDGTQRPIILSN